jgi:hypothetical protein
VTDFAQPLFKLYENCRGVALAREYAIHSVLTGHGELTPRCFLVEYLYPTLKLRDGRHAIVQRIEVAHAADGVEFTRGLYLMDHRHTIHALASRIDQPHGRKN